MLDYFLPLLNQLRDSPLDTWAQTLPEQIQRGLSEQRYGDLTAWRQALEALPTTEPSTIELAKAVRIGSAQDCSDETLAAIRHQFQQLIPWRKGPFYIHDMHIDTEWRSDWKWDRVLPHLQPLKDRQVLDIGCGNGYHCLRSYGEGAARVIGIDPSPRFVVQYYMIKHFLGDIPVDVLPLAMEDMPAELEYFDTTFSMGVLYHRRSPMDHLKALKDTLRPGGELVLETLLVDGELGDTLVPEGRYAMMNNVWFLPSAATLISWLKKCGFKNPQLVDINQTTLEEQRQTPWMKFHSLEQFLDPDDHGKTVEGHPAPLRGVFVAEK